MFARHRPRRPLAYNVGRLQRPHNPRKRTQRFSASAGHSGWARAGGSSSGLRFRLVRLGANRFGRQPNRLRFRNDRIWDRRGEVADDLHRHGGPAGTLFIVKVTDRLIGGDGDRAGRLAGLSAGGMPILQGEDRKTSLLAWFQQAFHRTRQVFHMPDQPVRLQFGDRHVGIAELDPNYRNAGAARGANVSAGIPDHHRSR